MNFLHTLHKVHEINQLASSKTHLNCDPSKGDSGLC
jgi:hypothetical protein